MGKTNRSLVRAFTILEFLAAHGPARLRDVALECDLSPATALRFLDNLCTLGYVRAADGFYSFTPRLRLLAGPSRGEAIRLLQTQIEGLAEETQLTAFVAAPDGSEVLYLYRGQPRSAPVVVGTRIGRRAPFHCTGVGKVLLAYLPDAELRRRLTGLRLRAFTEHTLTTRTALRRELARVNEQGFALDDEECELGLRCVAVPVASGAHAPWAALSLSGPTSAMSRERAIALAPRLKQAAAELAAALAPEDVL